MKKSSILAHRGWFLKASEKNSHLALNRALDYGFGIETDVRDLNGELVISHDPPVDSPDLPRLGWLLGQIGAKESRIALNIKSDGLASAICEIIRTSSVNSDQIYMFDMSIPDSISYLNTSLNVYSRLSEYEDKPLFHPNIRGVWVDSFTGDYPQVHHANEVMNNGIRAAIVSPELHQRDHYFLWKAIANCDLHHNSLFDLCTDFPAEAAAQFCDF